MKNAATAAAAERRAGHGAHQRQDTHDDDENGSSPPYRSRTGRFTEVGHASRGRHGHNTKVIDLRGRTVVPGIIDNHNHIC